MKSSSIIIIKLFVLLLLVLITSGCPNKPQYPPNLNADSSPDQAIMYLSFHLRANRGQFLYLAQQLKKYPQLTHYRSQADTAVTQLLAAGMWQNNGMKHKIHRQLGDTLSQLKVASIMKKRHSLIFHIANIENSTISSTYNLVYNSQGLESLGHVSNNRKDRQACDQNYLISQYSTMKFGSCYTQLMPAWYIHHAYQHN